MNFVPIRLKAGHDLRHTLENLVHAHNGQGAFVISGIGSLDNAKLRFAGDASETLIAGPLEIVSIAGSLTLAGAHLHMAVSDKDGRVTGGHVGYGNIIRTTLEALLVLLPTWELTREFDAATGFKELVVQANDSVA